VLHYIYMKRLYAAVEQLCQKIFYDENCKTSVWVNNFLSFVILLSITSIVLDSVSAFSQYHTLFITIEYVAVGIFTIEYIGRIIGAKKKLSYIFSFYGIIDLLSMLPTYLHLANFTVLKSIRVLRILRFLRVMRLVKVARFEHMHVPTQHIERATNGLNLQIYFLALFVVVFILGNFAYIFEHNHPHFDNIPLSMLWVLESILGGSISTVVPETYGGIAVMMLARFTGFILLGFIVHIVGRIALQTLLGKEKQSDLQDGF
jgi:voltage-gated potassium channel